MSLDKMPDTKFSKTEKKENHRSISFMIRGEKSTIKSYSSK